MVLLCEPIETPVPLEGNDRKDGREGQGPVEEALNPELGSWIFPRGSWRALVIPGSVKPFCCYGTHDDE